MEEGKKKNNTALIILVVLLMVVCLGMGGYIFISKDNKSTNFEKTNNDANRVQSNNTQNNTTKNTNAENSVKNNIIIFDGSKSLNSSEKSYTLSCQGNAGIWINATQKELTFSFTPSKVVQFYQLNWTSSNNDMSSSTITFDKKIIDIFFGSMGQSSTGDTLFILLEDGTVEYIPIVHMFNHAQAAPISYGKINGVTDVTKFVLSSTTGGVTTLAVKSDGSFYDMWYALKNTGNY